MLKALTFPIDYRDRKPLGKTKETTSAIGLGTWAIRSYLNAEKAFLKAIEDGIDLIDTAEMYDTGNAEVFVGKVIKLVGRDNVFVVTKLLPSRFRSEETVEKAARSSLERLGIKYADLILIHWPDYSTPIKTQVRNLERLIEKGFTRYIGVSNFSKEELEEALWALKKYDIVADQVKYSVINKDVEKDLLPFALNVGVTIQAYTPIERGQVKHVAKIQELSKKYDRPPVAIALNYLISRPMVVAIVKTENLEHLKEIEEALGWRLKEEDLELLSRI